MGSFTIMTGRGGTKRRYRQGHGRRRHGRGPKMNAFKGFMKKGLAFGKKHILPHVKEIGKNVLLNALEGRNIGQSLKSHSRQTTLNSLSRTRRRRPR